MNKEWEKSFKDYWLEATISEDAPDAYDVYETIWKTACEYMRDKEAIALMSLIRKNSELQKKLDIAIEALSKIEDKRKRDHHEPNDYTEKCCLMNIAHEALEKIKELDGH